MLDWHDIIGVTGTGLAVLAYLLTQLRKLNSDDLLFPLMNLAGSVMVAISLAHNFNLASALMEFFWIVISLIGIATWALSKRS